MSQREEFDSTESESSARGAYLSRRDVKIMLIVVVAAMVVLLPIYYLLKGRSEKALCAANFGAMSRAMGMYIEINDDRFPPLYAAEGGNVLVDGEGRPFTWASLLRDLMSVRHTFACPSAGRAETAVAQHPRESALSVPMSYGMYAPYSGYPVHLVDNAATTAIVVETASNGALRTFNPLRFTASDGSILRPDGFVIGFDNDLLYPNRESRAVTRLAFPGTADGQFPEDGRSRHAPDGIHVLYIDGHTGLLQPPAAVLQRDGGGNIIGPWELGPDIRR
jgi:hypothetical protein